MPSISNRAPKTGQYIEDLRGESPIERKNPWAMLAEASKDMPDYTIEQDGNFYYRYGEAMNRFAELKRLAQKDQDDSKATYYDNQMKATLDTHPIPNISDAEVKRLSVQGKGKYARLMLQQAKMMGDQQSMAIWQRRYQKIKDYIENQETRTTPETFSASSILQLTDQYKIKREIENFRLKDINILSQDGAEIINEDEILKAKTAHFVYNTARKIMNSVQNTTRQSLEGESINRYIDEVIRKYNLNNDKNNDSIDGRTMHDIINSNGVYKKHKNVAPARTVTDILHEGGEDALLLEGVFRLQARQQGKDLQNLRIRSEIGSDGYGYDVVEYDRI